MFSCNCNLHFWQNDRDFLRATVVTRGWNGYRNKSQHRKSTQEKKILPPFQQGFEPATFQSRVRRSNHWAIPAPIFRPETRTDLNTLFRPEIRTDLNALFRSEIRTLPKPRLKHVPSFNRLSDQVHVRHLLRMHSVHVGANSFYPSTFFIIL